MIRSYTSWTSALFLCPAPPETDLAKIRKYCQTRSLPACVTRSGSKPASAAARSPSPTALARSVATRIGQHQDGPGVDGDVVAGASRRDCGVAGCCRVVGVDIGTPRCLPPGGWQDELERFPPRVDQDHEVVIQQPRSVFGPVRVIGAVQVQRDGQGVVVRPVGGRHLGACGSEPAQLGCFCPGKETAAAEHRMCLAEGDKPPGEVLYLGVRLGPVKPGHLVVLAVGVVV